MTSAELATLRRLRARFLASNPVAGDYWQSPNDLALYDSTFGERIGWKWDAVLRELAARGWQPQSRRLFDFGCGSGIAGRRVLDHWPEHFTSMTLHDRSRLAGKFAFERARDAHPSLELRVTEAPEALPSDSLLVISHVLNELSAKALATLVALAGQAREILWVEAGAHAESRCLIAEVREPLLAAGAFTIVAPCTHAAVCGLLTQENSRHWCHSFAAAPSEVFQNARWAEFSRELGVDLRALPYSFLVLQRGAGAARGSSGFSRIIGRPRDYKGYSRVLSCQVGGIADFTLQKRDAPALLREIQKDPGASLFRWTLCDEKIVAGERLEAKT